jgi:hypothetical protein
MNELWGILVVGFLGVAFGYVWLTHVVDSAVESAIDEHTERLDQLESRLDELEAAVEDDR